MSFMNLSFVSVCKGMPFYYQRISGDIIFSILLLHTFIKQNVSIYLWPVFKDLAHLFLNGLRAGQHRQINHRDNFVNILQIVP